MQDTVNKLHLLSPQLMRLTLTVVRCLRTVQIGSLDVRPQESAGESRRLRERKKRRNGRLCQADSPRNLCLDCYQVLSQ